jgi:hypothetical protein
MSNSATSAAKRRRAGPLLASPLFQSPNSFQQPKPESFSSAQIQESEPPPQIDVSRGLTLQQCINLIDNRLVKLEKAVVLPVVLNSNASENTNEKLLNEFQETLNQHLEEFNHRYELLASEISMLKDTVLGLQKYTMDINKTLVEERIHILSDIKSNAINVDENINYETLQEPVDQPALTEILNDQSESDVNNNLELKDVSTIIQSKKKGGKKVSQISLSDVV